MFSYFKKGITDTVPQHSIDINDLVTMIKNNPQASKIEAIREMKAEGRDYSEIKKTLPYITPGAICSKRDLSCIEFASGYIYLDIDNAADISVMKKNLIENYGNLITMLCLSCSGAGLSILIKIKGIQLSKDNYVSVREYVIKRYFKELSFDDNTKDISRAWFISYDKDVYYNTDSFIKIEEGISDNINNNTSLIIVSDTKSKKLKKADYDVSFLNISEVLNTLKFKTEVEVKNRIFDIKPVEYCEVHMPLNYKIPNGKKKATFIKLTHNLTYLNPDIDGLYILSYLNYINNTRAVAKAKQSDFVRLFKYTYDNIRDTGVINADTRIKYVHFREKTISGKQRMRLANQLTGLIKQASSIEKITLAKEVLIAQNEKLTQKAVFRLIQSVADENGRNGISIATIKRYWNHEPVDIQEIATDLNNQIQITYVDRENKSSIHN